MGEEQVNSSVDPDLDETVLVGPYQPEVAARPGIQAATLIDENDVVGGIEVPFRRTKTLA